MTYFLKSFPLRLLIIILLTGSLTGCLHWMRAFQTYLQLSQFDKNFVINDNNAFEVHFNSPILYNKASSSV